MQPVLHVFPANWQLPRLLMLTKQKYHLMPTSGSITNWHGSCTTQDMKAPQWVIKTTHNMVPNNNNTSVASVKWDDCTELKGHLRTTPTQHPSLRPRDHLPKDTQVFSALRPDYRAASLLQAVRLLNSSATLQIDGAGLKLHFILHTRLIKYICSVVLVTQTEVFLHIQRICWCV